jgi:hypothetical protein
MLSALFALVILEIGSLFLPRTAIPYFKLPTITRMTGTCHQDQAFSTEMGSLELFAWAGLEPIFLISVSQVASFTVRSHWHPVPGLPF